MLDIDSIMDIPAGIRPQLPPGTPEPVWELATMYPAQGEWSVGDYLTLTDGTISRIEFTNGRLEILAVPTELHQLILIYLFDALRKFVEPQLGKVMLAGMRIRTASDRFREPDLMVLTKANESKRDNRYWHGADLVMEIVSADELSHQRDYVTKVSDYAAAKIPEYWIVDPHEKKVTIYSLAEGAIEYSRHGLFVPGELAASKLLEGFTVDVTALFAAGEAAAKGE